MNSKPGWTNNRPPFCLRVRVYPEIGAVKTLAAAQSDAWLKRRIRAKPVESVILTLTAVAPKTQKSPGKIFRTDSEINKAFTYTLNQWDALRRYTEDGCLSIDNNLAERQVKLPAIGRKNWLFVGSECGGDRAAILLSIIASAKLCQVEPWA